MIADNPVSIDLDSAFYSQCLGIECDPDVGAESFPFARERHVHGEPDSLGFGRGTGFHYRLRSRIGRAGVEARFVEEI
jgi:hypothetical protein